MGNWTEQQFRDYATRRLRDSERARERMLVKAKMPVSEMQKILDDPNKAAKLAELGWPMDDMKKAVQKSRNGYNTAVVLAWFKECGLPEPMVEHRFDPDRKWRFDFAWVGRNPPWGNAEHLALECNGGLWTGGAHVRPARMLKEFEKWNRAAVLGWRVMFTTPSELCTKDLADQIREALAI